MNISWLLLKKSARQSTGRLALTASAIALGFLIILVFTASVNALTARQSHSLWRGINSTPIANASPLLYEIITEGNLNKWQNTSIDVLSVRATDNTSPMIANLPTPTEGEYYTSKALEKLIEQNPDEQINLRFGTVNLGTIPDKYVGSPDELLVFKGMSQADADAKSQENKLGEVYSYIQNPKPASFDGLVGFILIFGGIILLFPIVMFIVIATQLGSAQREKRYAAMRLVGATQNQVTRIMSLESLCAALAGIAIGTLAYIAVRVAMAEFYYEGMRFWPNDITVSFGQFISIAILTITLSLGATWWGMRRTRTSPLGITRDQKANKQPRLLKLMPLLTGISIFIFIATPFGRTILNEAIAESPAPLFVLIAGIVLIMFGLVWAGPWLTYSVAKMFAAKTKNAQTLLATKRISGNATQVFRSVSGVVLALFAGSFYLTAVSGIDKLDAKSINNNGYSLLNPGTAIAIGSPLPADFQQTLDSEPYVVSSAFAYQTEQGSTIQCRHLATYTELSCPESAKPTDFVSIDFEKAVDQTLTLVSDPPKAAPRDYLVQLDTNDNLDKLRTLVAVQLRDENRPGYVVSGTYAQIALSDPLIKELAGLAYLGMAVTLFVAIASLIVSTIGGMLERQKSLITLRLSGLTIGQMKQVVMIESLIPLLVVSLLAASIGVWVGSVFINTLSTSVEPTLTPIYFVIVASSLIIASLAIYLVLPILVRLTSFEENRTE